MKNLKSIILASMLSVPITNADELELNTDLRLNERGVSKRVFIDYLIGEGYEFGYMLNEIDKFIKALKLDLPYGFKIKAHTDLGDEYLGLAIYRRF